MKKQMFAFAACLTLAFGLSGCGEAAKSGSEKVVYADEMAVSTIAKGWQDRADIVDAIDTETMADDVKYGAALQEGIQAEIDADSSLKDEKYRDSKLQETVLAYINILDEQYELAGEFDSTDFDFLEDWQKVYDERSTILKTFADDYDMTVDDEYADEFKQILVDGKSAQEKNDKDDAINSLIAAAEWEKTDDGYGYYTYSAVIENTSDYDFTDVSVTLNLYDEDDVKSETYVSANTWKKGEKVKFEASDSVDAQRIEGIVTYYDVAD